MWGNVVFFYGGAHEVEEVGAEVEEVRCELKGRETIDAVSIVRISRGKGKGTEGKGRGGEVNTCAYIDVHLVKNRSEHSGISKKWCTSCSKKNEDRELGHRS